MTELYMSKYFTWHSKFRLSLLNFPVYTKCLHDNISGEEMLENPSPEMNEKHSIAGQKKRLSPFISLLHKLWKWSFQRGYFPMGEAAF